MIPVLSTVFTRTLEALVGTKAERGGGMKQYQNQKFLLQCPYETIDLKKFYKRCPTDIRSIKYERDLFDYPKCKRYVFLKYLDYNVDTERDLVKILNTVDYLDVLYIIDDRPFLRSPFANKHSESTKKAFLWQIREYGIKCYWAKKLM